MSIKMIELELDKKRIFKISTMFYITVEDVLDKPISKINFESMSSIFAMIYAGLLATDYSLTYTKFISIIDELSEQYADTHDVGIMTAQTKVINELMDKVSPLIQDASKGMEALPKK